MVLIITQPDDYHAEVMKAILTEEYGERCVLLDTSCFPLHLKSTFQYSKEGELVISWNKENSTIDANEIKSVWWRRPQPCDVDSGMNQIDGSFFQAECDHFLQGVFYSLDCFWVNDPVKNRMASRKLFQLKKAKQVGLKVPETCVTNDPEVALDFIRKSPGKVIYKRTGTSPGALSKTSFVDESTINGLNSISFSPTTFQEYIRGVGDIRTIWINGQFFSVKIDSHKGRTPEDSRFDHSVDYAAVQLPHAVENRLTVFMNELGLVYGAIDLRVNENDEIYFLEVNPSGQFAYLQVKTKLPIMETLAAVLSKGKLN